MWWDAAALPPAVRRERFETEQEKQRYYQQRSKQARTSHTKTRRRQLSDMGIDVDKIKSCVLETAVK